MNFFENFRAPRFTSLFLCAIDNFCENQTDVEKLPKFDRKLSFPFSLEILDIFTNALRGLTVSLMDECKLCVSLFG